MGRNAGFAAANNAGIRERAAICVLLLNSDTLVPPGALIGSSSGCSRPAAPRSPAHGWWMREGRPELSFGRMISPLNELRQKRRTAEWIAARNRARAVRRLGQRRLPARAPGGRRGRRPARRAILPLHRGRRLLPRRPRARRRVLFTPAAEITHLRGRSRASQPGASQAALPPQPPGLLREAPSAVGATAASVPALARAAEVVQPRLRIAPRASLT